VYTQEQVLELVELIYRAAGDPAEWPRFVQRLAGVLTGTIATIHHQRPGASESDFAASWNMDPAAIESYAKYYGALNLWFTTRPHIHAQGAVYTSQMLCPEDLLVRSEFYNDWLEPQGMYQGAGATIFKNGPLSSIISIFRPRKAERFDGAEVGLLRILLPHLQRAFQLHNRIQGLERNGAAAADALDLLEQGVVLLDAKGCVLLVNRAADAILAAKKALRLTPHGLVAAVASENRQLSRLIQGAIATGKRVGLDAGGAMVVSRDGQRAPLHVLIAPLGTKTIHLGGDVPVAAIFISDPEHKPASNGALLVQLFGLTRAEARLAEILAAGESLLDAAQKLGVAQSTVRSQLKSIFGKTNTNRQSQLVSVLAHVNIRISH
jgi:DNA-binding CsgD family transcriptional regulator/PAS domain-containing protein